MKTFFEFLNTNSNITAITDKLRQYQNGAKASKYVPIYIDCAELIKHCGDFFQQSLDKINATLYAKLFEACEQILSVNAIINCELFVVPRLINLADQPLIANSSNSLSSRHINRIVRLIGIVTHVDRLRVFARHTVYRCKKCRHTVKIKIKSVFDLCSHPAPAFCQKNCNSTSFDVISDVKANFIDYQEIVIRLDENGSKQCNSQLPTFVSVILQYEQVDQCQPGEHVIFYGLVKCKVPFLSCKIKCFTDIVLIANHFELLNNVNQVANNIVSLSYVSLSLQDVVGFFASNLYGMPFLKLATIATLNSINVVGGVGNERCNCHLLISGGSGCGKTQLFNAAMRLVSNSVFVVGTNTSKAGLTASVVRDSDGFFTLEPGALPLSDEGLCVIDEFDRLAADDLNAIHEAMEQQTVTVSKAGVISRLRCKSTLLCCKSNSKKILPTPLYSRFDLIFVLQDKFDEKRDHHLANHIFLNNNITLEQNEQQLKTYLQQIGYKNVGSCTVSQSASGMIKNFYNEKINEKHADSSLYSSRTTTRLLESLIRLSMSIAKLQNKTFVDDSDAALAILLMQVSFLSLGFVEDTNTTNYLNLIDCHEIDDFFNLLNTHIQTIKQNYKQNYIEQEESLINANTQPNHTLMADFGANLDLSGLSSLCNSDID